MNHIMIEQNSGNIKLLKFQNLLNQKESIHFSSTRIGGGSKGILSTLNLGYTVDDNPKLVTKNIELLQNSIGLKNSKIVFPNQTHSNNVGIVENDQDTFSDTDALVTNKPGICIAVRTADCVPILLLDPVHKVVAAVHSGWKGTIKKISQVTIETMQQQFGTNPHDIVASIGPSIGSDVYEVGYEVVEQFNNEFGKNVVIVPRPNSNKGLLNLWKANKLILLESGVQENNIEIAELCTYSNPKLFYSARRDSVKCGRLASGIMIKV